MQFHSNKAILRLTSSAIILAGICSCNAVFAAAKCNIENGPAKPLETYLKNLDTVLRDTDIEIRKNSCGNKSLTSDASKLGNDLLKSANLAISTDNFISSTAFYVKLAMDSEIPPGINRDNDLLQSYTKKIQTLFTTAGQYCANDKASPASYATNAPDHAGESIAKELDVILQNHYRILNRYREIVTNIESDKANNTLVLAPSNFLADMRSEYGPNSESLKACKKNTDDWKKVSEAINRIVETARGNGDAFKEWQEAWKLMNSGPKDKAYAALERQLLEKELKRQGVSPKASERMLGCLAKSNAGNGCSLIDPEGITKTLEQVGEIVQAAGETMKGAFKGFMEVLDGSKNTDSLKKKLQEQTTLRSDLWAEMVATYADAKKIIGSNSSAMDANVSGLIEIHSYLKKSHETLQGYGKVAQKVCNDQAQNKPSDCSGK